MNDGLTPRLACFHILDAVTYSVSHSNRAVRAPWLDSSVLQKEAAIPATCSARKPTTSSPSWGWHKLWFQSTFALDSLSCWFLIILVGFHSQTPIFKNFPHILSCFRGYRIRHRSSCASTTSCLHCKYCFSHSQPFIHELMCFYEQASTASSSRASWLKALSCNLCSLFSHRNPLKVALELLIEFWSLQVPAGGSGKMSRARTSLTWLWTPLWKWCCIIHAERADTRGEA